MSLRDDLLRAVTGQGGFRLNGGNLSAGDRVQAFRPLAGRIVLWPLANTAAAAVDLLAALAAGVVPVVTPANLPPAKWDDLRAKFPRFGVYEAGVATQGEATSAKLLLALMTIGSTGTPTLLAIDDEALVCGIDAIHTAQPLAEVRSTGVVLPLANSYVLVNQLLWAVRHERGLYLDSGSLPAGQVLDMFRTQGVEMLCLMTCWLRSALDPGPGQILDQVAPLPDAKVVNFAGAAFPSESWASLRKLFPNAHLINNYGCAEAMPRIALREVFGPDDAASWVGAPLPTIEVRVEPDGAIRFRGGSTSIGRLRPDGGVDPHGEWIDSGDAGEWREGSLHVLGRHDQIVKVAGERLSLADVERALQIAGFAAAVAWSGEDGIVAAAPTGPAPARNVVRHALRAHLPNNAWPKVVHGIAEWPRLANGKTDRTRVRALANAGPLPVVLRLG